MVNFKIKNTVPLDTFAPFGVRSPFSSIPKEEKPIRNKKKIRTENEKPFSSEKLNSTMTTKMLSLYSTTMTEKMPSLYLSTINPHFSIISWKKKSFPVTGSRNLFTTTVHASRSKVDHQISRSQVID